MHVAVGLHKWALSLLFQTPLDRQSLTNGQKVSPTCSMSLLGYKHVAHKYYHVCKEIICLYNTGR